MDHFRVDHTPTHNVANIADGGSGNVGIRIFGIGDNNIVVPEVVEDSEINAVAIAVDGGTVARIRAAGLL